MKQKLFVDTNVMVDLLARRIPFRAKETCIYHAVISEFSRTFVIINFKKKDNGSNSF